KASDVMTQDVASLDASLCIQDAIAEFQSHPHSTYPVTTDGKVVGLLRRSVAYDWLKNHGLTCRDHLKDLPLTTPFRVRGETPVPELVQTLMRSGVSKAIVVDGDDRLLGMVTVFDLLRGSR
ncbi:MAG: CBS domain-containing protein, partial [Verrucomicrobiales bacterium]|nr:CBS domain-containing protein [Verrucomicrobiales bacterium]